MDCSRARLDMLYDGDGFEHNMAAKYVLKRCLYSLCAAASMKKISQ
jgi:hypothetical protein